MNKLAAVSVPQVDSLVISILPPKRICLQGTITLQEPSRILGGFLKSVHDAAIADGIEVLELDATALKFVNSSAIRLFLDWASWIKASKEPTYRLRIMTTRKYTWQKTSFVAITALAAGHVETAPVD
jgi:hypothetical protein